MLKRVTTMILGIILIIGLLPYNRVGASPIGNNWVESSYPEMDQGTIDSERVERNPVIEIKFKYDVDLIDKSKISLSSDGDRYGVDVNKDTWISYDRKTLKIDVNSLCRSGKNPLRPNTAYRLTIGKNALRLENHKEVGSEAKIYNDEIILYFITGEETIPGYTGLKVEKYTSSEDMVHDNISSYSTSKLEKDGSIYIHFNEDIRWNKWTANPKVEKDEEALKYFKLYKIPKAYKKNKNSLGETFDSEFRYDEGKRNLPLGANEEVEIESVEIVKDKAGNRRVIKVTPKEDLLWFNKYNISLTKRDILTDDFEKVLIKGIDQTIWTRADGEESRPQWLMENITPGEIIENEKGPKKSYTIHGTPNYNEHIDEPHGKPIILFVDREVVLNPKITWPSGDSNINALNKISLHEGFKEDGTPITNIGWKWYQIEYYYEKEIKKTKISLYPKKELHSGTYYRLDIKNDVFKSRSDKSLEGVELNFVVEGKGTKAKGIYELGITNKSDFITAGSKRPFIVSDFNPGKDNMEINITGYNFTEDISKIRFVRDSDRKTIEILPGDLKFNNVTKITGTIKGNAKKEFNKDSSAGVYRVYIDFLDGTMAGEGRFSVRHNRPQVKRTMPVDGDRYFDPGRLYEYFTAEGEDDEEGYYLEVVFDNIYGALKLMNPNIDLSKISLTIEGDTENLVDSTRVVRYRNNSLEYTVYIPIIEELMENQRYNVSIKENSLVYYGDMAKEEAGNLPYSWSFSTNYLPKAERLYEGSLPEYYDERYPIVIDGEMFHPDTTVEFRDMRGYTYRAHSVTMRDNNTLYVYLPRRPRLDIGLYDIVIRNGRNHEMDMVHGVLSVVEEGRHIPNEEYRVKDESSRETVKEIIGSSKDILELGPRQRDRSYVEIELDELMGVDSWVRSIEYPSGWSDSINELRLKSKWANTTIRNLRLDRAADERYIELRVGRVEPTMEDILKKKLIHRNIKSNFMEVSGANFQFDQITIEIPYFQSDGRALKMVRYDEETRGFKDMIYTIDLLEGKLKGVSHKPGIFVIVE